MKLTAIAALIATTSAHKGMNSLGTQMYNTSVHHSKKPIEHKNYCEGYDKSGDLKDTEFIRKLYYTMWNATVKGWYHSQRRNTVNIECMGSWMDESFANMNEVMDLLDQNRIFEITAPKVKKIADDSIDFFYKNAEKCEIYRFTNDQYNWCANNVGVCLYQDDFINRMIQSATPLMSKALDLGTLMMSDETTCLNDSQNLELIDRIITDFASIASSFVGFEGKWGQSAVPNQTFEEMQKAVDDAQATYEKEHPKQEAAPQNPTAMPLGYKFENPFGYEFTPPNLGGLF